MKPRFVLSAAVAAAGIAGCGAWLAFAATAARERELFRHAGADLVYADSLERSLAARPATDLQPGEALAALYLERLRLGLGSPFRLIDQVARETALKPVNGTRLADAMLARTLVGDAYTPGRAALSLVSSPPAGSAAGSLHQSIIDSVVASAEDPRIGELTVRLAYRLSEAAGSVSRRGPELATAAAAQARDRVLAMRDARRVIDAAERRGLSRLATVRLWRETRRLAVEQPVLAPLTARAERDAVAGVPALVALIERLGASGEAGAGSYAARSPGERRRTEALASRMATIAARRDLPPVAPITIAVRGYAALLTGGAADDWPARARFVRRASNEETLAAEYALLSVRVGPDVAAADAAILTSAVGLRPFAQDQARVPGDPGPTVRDLQARLGIAVTHDSSARAAWRPFLHRALETAVVDMKRVFPGFDPRGLRVHFGRSPLGDRALAMHDPVRRTIWFPPASSSGVMAHEFAHDLDWQAARREFGGTGWYRTDHALRRSSDRLAGALRLMAGALRTDTVASRGGSGRSGNGSDRPTEIMARNVDWFVSAQLAREGRINGHLSAAQDPVLTGFASAVTPEAAHDGGAATLVALDGLTTVPDAARDWFTSLYGADRKVTVHEAVRRVLEAPLRRVNLAPRGSGPAWEWTVGPVASPAAWTCLVDGFAARGNDPAAVRAVVQYAAESRARGVIRQWSHYARQQPGASPLRLRALTGGPWDPQVREQVQREIRDAILLSALSQRRELAEFSWAVAAGTGGRCPA